MLRSSFIFIILSFILFGCSSTKSTTKSSQKKKIISKTLTVIDTVFIEKKAKKNYKAADLNNYNISDIYFPANGQDFRQKHLIFHYTALHNDKSYEVLTQQAVSSHYIISDKNDDKIDILVSEDARAWHAGISYWNGRNNLNDSSIGIEIVNQGYTSIDTIMTFFTFKDYQISKVGELAQSIVQRYGIEPVNVLAHSDIAPQRKKDPGPLFPWKLLYEKYNVGAWYDYHTKTEFLDKYPKDDINTVRFILELQSEFEKYGYEIQKTGNWDLQTKRVIMAFQMHFRPIDYSGYIDAETWAILKALNKKYR